MIENVYSLCEHLFGGFGLLIPIWFFHIIPICIIGIPIWYFWRRRVKWTAWDYAVGWVPFLVWGVLMVCHDKGKTLSNLGEGILLGFFTPIAPIIRAQIKDRVDGRILTVALLVVLCLVAVGLWAFMPALPE